MATPFASAVRSSRRSRHQRRHRVRRRHDRRLDVALRGGFRRHRPDGRDDRGRQQIRRRLGAEHSHEIAHARRAREGDHVDSAVRAACGRCPALLRAPPRRHRAVGDRLGDVRAALAQLIGQQLAADVGVGQQHLEAGDVGVLRDRLEQRVGAVLARARDRPSARNARADSPSPRRRRTASRRGARAGPAWSASSRSTNASTAFVLENTIQ